MTNLRAGCAAAVLSLCIGPALAEGDWRTVSVDGDPGFTIDVPADVGDDYDTSDEDDWRLTFGAAAEGGRTVLECQLARSPYDDGGVTRDETVQSLKEGMACNPSPLYVAQDVSIETRRSVALGGAPADECLVSMKGAPSSAPPQLGYSVEFNYGVAGRQSLFFLICVDSASTREEAMTAWRGDWAAKVSHIEQSLQLPKDEK